jgi:hypothetical protein
MQQCTINYCFLVALHVSSYIFAHHQKHLNCIYSLLVLDTCVVAGQFHGRDGADEVSSNSPDHEHSTTITTIRR